MSVACKPPLRDNRTRRGPCSPRHKKRLSVGGGPRTRDSKPDEEPGESELTSRWVRSLGHADPLPTAPLHPHKSLLEIRDQVIRILDPDGDADQRIGNSHAVARLFGDAGV